MPLKIQLKKSQKIIINGAVLENASQRSVSLLIANDAAILRDSDILTPEDAVTPASRTYYALQCMYVFPGTDDNPHHKQFMSFLDNYEKAAPSSRLITSAVREMVEQSDLYHALKKCQELIFHEKELLADVQEELSSQL
ncbi:flagellar biosynthesis repressor FlbT [Magnetospira sp. QH-2]|uniref:flagellar biosynthesis repressor FlbT n=1 Tax=Magnetospira sp. (strain QH-2) TaxID=1288970 RepID=UPI0003E8106C|nr:flagellar biosynthesis repressor FlbT [Magnetospira sp. QH-2]CCQ74173.1 flagellar biosynthesis repressor FlbT [Magnetospira sp. QH-2]